MSDRTYQPTGHGLCATCGRDVGEHDGGHRFTPQLFIRGRYLPRCWTCDAPYNAPIHDVGRVLRCPAR